MELVSPPTYTVDSTAEVLVDVQSRLAAIESRLDGLAESVGLLLATVADPTDTVEERLEDWTARISLPQI